ncbi:pseudouridine synthase [Akkermansia glycaniphila]|nr:pseudouridine synthase [Akkermansia glycaniphila]
MRREDAPEGSEEWTAPWVQLKYFSYNPAIFPRMLGAVSPDARDGQLINVYDKNGELFGGGFWNEKSRTPLRVLAHGRDVLTEKALDDAIRKAVAWRRDVCRLDEVTNAYRVLHGDSDGIGGLIVDRYNDVLSLEVSTLGAWLRLDRWLPLLHELCGTSRHVVQVDESIARMEGIDTRQAPSSDPVRLVRIHENGVQFEVDFAQGHKTGFFCDQRDNRLKLSQLVQGKTVLDLCCYSGGFSILAKKLGGAAEVTAVDLDEKAIAMAKRNANINGQQRIDFVHADAFVYARQMVRNGRLFDVVLLDPPKFVQGRDEAYEEGIKKYHDLNMLGLQCVRPGGLFVTCSCSGLVSPGEFEKTVIKAAQRLGRRLQIVQMSGPGWDHPFLSTYPEGRYLKVLWARVL